MKTIYLIGSLRNPEVPNVATQLRTLGFDVFDDWHAAGPEADDCWMRYEQFKGHDLKQALKGYAAKHVFAFDQHHLGRADIGILVLPAGKSGHLELGYLCGQGKRCYVLFDKEPERFDVMYQFATGGTYYSPSELMDALKKDYPNENIRRRQLHRPVKATGQSRRVNKTGPHHNKHVAARRKASRTSR
jgi:hypothetical protein